MLDYATTTPTTAAGKVISLFPSHETFPDGRTYSDPPKTQVPFSFTQAPSQSRSARRQRGTTPATMRFRNALIETDNALEFRDGCQAGYACAADLLEAGIPLTSDMLATHLTQALLDEAPQAFNVGFVLSMVETLCGPQKATPQVRRKRSTKKG